MIDCVVVGVGGVGSAALEHLTRLGVEAVGLDRFEPGHDRGSSHGVTRVIRLAYFEDPGYVPLLRRAYELWTELETFAGRELYRETGLVEIGPPDGEVVPGVLRSAREHGLTVEELTADEVWRRFPGLRCPGGYRAVLETRAGFLHVEACVRAHADRARHRGARIEAGVEVRRLDPRADHVRVETSSGTLQASRVVLTPGPWAGSLMPVPGLTLEVRRKPLLWFRCDDPRHDLSRGAPIFLYELERGVFYGFPWLDGDGVKVAEHTGGDLPPDPLTLDRTLRPEDVEPVSRFVEAHLAGVSTTLTRHAVCMYTMSPDGHFVVGPHPASDRILVCAGLSGHGFKFASVLGEILAALVTQGGTDLPIDFLSPGRFG